MEGYLKAGFPQWVERKRTFQSKLILNILVCFKEDKKEPGVYICNELR